MSCLSVVLEKEGGQHPPSLVVVSLLLLLLLLGNVCLVGVDFVLDTCVGVGLRSSGSSGRQRLLAIRWCLFLEDDSMFSARDNRRSLW